MSEPRVTIPLYTYNAMASCYYGNGPRFNQALPDEVPVPSPSQREGEILTSSVTDYTPEELPVEEWIPKGAAAVRKAGSGGNGHSATDEEPS